MASSGHILSRKGQSTAPVQAEGLGVQFFAL
jgi:hypothetical protein